MTRDELARAVFRASHLTGQFLLRSGKTSSEYFDKYQFESNPRLLSAIAAAMAENLPAGIDYFGALEMGGIPIATAISLQAGVSVIFVRKEAKGYGTCKFAEGPPIAGKRLLLIEDVITTGGQVATSARELREGGAIIDTVFCVIDRSQGTAQALDDAGLRLRALFTMEELKKAGQA
jgi:orotate phosphoribosyltransferase